MHMRRLIEIGFINPEFESADSQYDGHLEFLASMAIYKSRRSVATCH
jgi:hypothetical protein